MTHEVAPGRPSGAWEAEFKQAGAAAFLVKPITAGAVLQSLERLGLSRHQAR